MTEYARFGLAGICLALIATIGIIVRIFYGYMSNHTRELMEVIRKNSQSLQRLSDTIDHLEDLIKERLK